MNYTLKQLQDRVNSMIKEQGEDAECAAWIYTKNDCHLKDEDGNTDYGNNVEDPALIARIFDDVGQIDYIYTMIQDCVDEVTEEQLMLQQQEMVWQSGKWHTIWSQTSKSCIVVKLKQFIPKMINNETLEMLTAREQLMEDIIAIVDEYFQAQINECDDMGELSNFEEAKDDLTSVLCDAVCKNFPAK